MSTVVGKPAKRIEGLEKITGSARYTEDLRLPGMLQARLLLSPHPHARLTALPKAAALAVPGVVAVLAEEDLPKGTSSGLLARRGEALYSGHPVAVVLAETEDAAADGLDRLAAGAEFEVLPAALDPREAMREDAPLVRRDGGHDEEAAAHATVDVKAGAKEQKPRNVANSYTFRRGDVEARISRTPPSRWSGSRRGETRRRPAHGPGPTGRGCRAGLLGPWRTSPDACASR